jgi:Ni,Fe-hydrogenase III large subunit
VTEQLTRETSTSGFSRSVAAEVEQGGRLMMLFVEPTGSGRRLIANVARGREVLRLEVTLAEAESSYPALTPLVPAAHWYERELHDLHGIEPVGHPRLEPLLRHRDGWELTDDDEPEHQGYKRLAGSGVFLIPYGPVRSGVFESVQYLVQTNGEDVAYCAQRLFFKRRGAERRIAEVPLELAVLVAERVSGTSSVAHALAFSQAVEELAESPAPLRAAAIRSVLAELERLYNHVEVIVRECEDASLSVAQASFAALKERLHRLMWRMTGNRFGRGAVVPGGVAIDLDAGALDVLRDELTRWGSGFRADLRALRKTDSFIDRIVTAGPLSHEDARDFGCVGPVARGSGIDADVRRDAPYAAYEHVDLTVPVERDGDAMARMEVRFAEIAGSLAIIDELARPLPVGECTQAIGPLRGERALGRAESARGETVYYLRPADDRRLELCKLRAASFANFGIFNRVFDGQVLTDFGFIEHSLGLSPAGCDA